MVLISGWFTQIIGVDAIFGAFIAGLIIPRDGDLAIVLTEKIEDVVTVSNGKVQALAVSLVSTLEFCVMHNCIIVYSIESVCLCVHATTVLSL
jgi:hypothetical protein